MARWMYVHREAAGLGRQNARTDGRDGPTVRPGSGVYLGETSLLEADMDAHVDFHEFVSARWVRLYRLAYLLTTDEAAAEDLQSFGQRILVVPSRDLVIVTQANSPPQRRTGRPATPLSTTRSPPSSPPPSDDRRGVLPRAGARAGSGTQVPSCPREVACVHAVAVAGASGMRSPATTRRESPAGRRSPHVSGRSSRSSLRARSTVLVFSPSTAARSLGRSPTDAVRSPLG